MALPKASIGNSASFQIAGTPYVYTASANKTIDFKYVTRAITVQSTGTANKISFDGGSNEMTLVQNKVYRLDVKCKQLIITCAAGTVSVVAELTSIEAGQMVTIVQSNYQWIYGCMDSSASNYNASANVDDGSCTYAPPATADYLFHLDGNVNNACAGTATMTLTLGGGSYVTGQSGFGNALQFDGVYNTGSLLELAFAGSNPACGSSDLCLDGEFTFDFWVEFANNTRTPNAYLGNHPGVTTGMFQSNNQGSTPAFTLGYLEPPPAFGLPTYTLQFLSPGATSQFGNTQNFYDLGGSQLTGWHHIAITRDSSNIVRLFLDGAGVPAAAVAGNGDSDAGFTDTSTFDLHTFQFGSIGHWAGLDFDGQIDELRIHKGVCLWDADFSSTSFIISPAPSTCS